MPNQRYEGRTAAEAAIRACEELGLTRSELRHTVVSDEGEMLNRRVVIEVEATVKRSPPAASEPSDAGRPRGGRDEGHAGADNADADRGGRSRRGRGGERSERTDRPARRPPPRRDDIDADAGVHATARDARMARGEPSPDSAEARPERTDRNDERGGRSGHGERNDARPPRGGDRPSARNEAGPSERGATSGHEETGESAAPRGRRPRSEGAQRPAAEAQGAEASSDEATGERSERGSRRGGRNRSRGGERDEARSRGGRSSPRSADESHEAEAGDAPRRNGRNQEHKRGQRDGIDNLLAMQPSQDFADIAVQKLPALEAVSERSKRVKKIVADLVQLMGFDLEARLVSENEAEIHVHLHGPSEKHAIGDKGEVLLALQFAVNRILSRQEDEGEQILVLDAGGYRQRRQLAIENLARDLAERALAHNKAVRLSPMSAHDRRIFHMALKDMEGIATQSEGDGVFRNLLILPAAFL